MTRQEAVKRLNHVYDCTADAMDGAAIDMAIEALQKENEPAPSEDNTGYENQKKYFRNNNDTSEKAKCQEAICQAVDNMITIYERMSPEEQNAWELGEANRRILDVQRMIEEDE